MSCVSGLCLSRDKRLFSTTRYEAEFEWIDWSFTKNGYMCKICELTAEPGPPRFFYKGVLLGTHRLENWKNTKK